MTEDKKTREARIAFLLSIVAMAAAMIAFGYSIGFHHGLTVGIGH